MRTIRFRGVYKNGRHMVVAYVEGEDVEAEGDTVPQAAWALLADCGRHIGLDVKIDFPFVAQEINLTKVSQ